MAAKWASEEWQGRVWALDGQVSLRERVTLLALAKHADGEGVCHPSHGRLAGMLGVGRRTVMRWLGALEERGLLAVEKRRRKDGGRSSNSYRLMLPAAAVAPPCDIHVVTAPVTPRCDSPCDIHGVTAELSVEPTIEPLLPADERLEEVQSPTPALSAVEGSKVQGPTINGQRPTADVEGETPTPTTQLGLFGTPAEDLARVLLRVPEGDRGAVSDLVGVGLREHGARALGVFLRQVAAWPAHRWGTIKHVPAYLATVLARCAEEANRAELAEREGRVRRELQAAEIERGRQLQADESERRTAERAGLVAAFQGLSEGAQRDVVCEAWEGLSPITRRVADRSRPLSGILGVFVQDAMRKRAPPAERRV